MKYLLLLFCVFFCKMAGASYNDITLAEVKAYSLKYCLEENYDTLHIFSTQDKLNDTSYSDTADKIQKKSQNKLTDLHKFIDENTSHYYKRISAEEKTHEVYNIVFFQCIQFYKSPKLTNFINKNIFLDNPENFNMANSHTGNFDTELLKDYSFQRCLLINYDKLITDKQNPFDKRIHAYKYATGHLNDASYTKIYRNNKYGVLNSYISKNARDYDSHMPDITKYPVQPNNIFYHCMHFYQSKSLNHFIEHLIENNLLQEREQEQEQLQEQLQKHFQIHYQPKPKGWFTDQ